MIEIAAPKPENMSIESGAEETILMVCLDEFIVHLGTGEAYSTIGNGNDLWNEVDCCFLYEKFPMQQRLKQTHQLFQQANEVRQEIHVSC